MNSDCEQVWGWLQKWWDLAGDIVNNFDDTPPSNPWQWEDWVSAGVYGLPATAAGVSTVPFTEFLAGIVSLWEPGPLNGPKRSKEELWELSSAAWRAYNRLQAEITAIREAAEDHTPDDAAGDSSGETSHVDDDYTERILKQHWAALLRISVKNIRRRLDDGRLRAHPKTARRDQYLRLHIDDLPKELKQRHDRKTAVEKLKQTTKRQ